MDRSELIRVYLWPIPPRSTNLRLVVEATVIVTPVLDDWMAFGALVPKLDAALAATSERVTILVVDDGSASVPAELALAAAPAAIDGITVVRLRRNLGHQRAIAVGLAYVFERSDARSIVVMDADGEDEPADVPRLLARMRERGDGAVVFAERARRSESLAFRVFYQFYRFLHLLLVGRAARVGNFSAFPRRALNRLVVVSELWNHFAAAVYRSRIPVDTVPTARGKRYGGRSSMSFIGLVVHGMSALSVYGDVVGVRLLASAAVLVAISLTGIGALVVVKVATSMVIAQWALITAGMLLLLCVQAVMFIFVLSVNILDGRNRFGFIPLRDYAIYIDEVVTMPVSVAESGA